MDLVGTFDDVAIDRSQRSELATEVAAFIDVDTAKESGRIGTDIIGLDKVGHPTHSEHISFHVSFTGWTGLLRCSRLRALESLILRLSAEGHSSTVGKLMTPYSIFGIQN